MLLCILAVTLLPALFHRVVNAASVPTSKVVSLPLRRATDEDVAKFIKRNHIASDISNDIRDIPSRYLMSVGVGTPLQNIDLWIDTGSSDTWLFTPDACSNARCIDGAFDPAQSSTYTNLFSTFRDCLGPGCIHGSYFRDAFSLGGIEINQLQLGLANSAPNYRYGILGLNGNQRQHYRILPQTLADQGWTHTAAFSIYMDDIEAPTGQILFGGYDTEKFTGNLKVFPWGFAQTGLSITDGDGNTTSYNSASFPARAIIDTGADYAGIPPDVYSDVATYFNVTCSGKILCSVADVPGTLNFQIGGDDGLEIHMPLRQLAKPRLVNGRLPTNSHGQTICDFTLKQGRMNGNFLGDPFLRNTYTIWDSDRQQIGMAQAKFNVSDGKSNIVEITPFGNLAGALDPTTIAFASVPSATSGFCGR